MRCQKGEAEGEGGCIGSKRVIPSRRGVKISGWDRARRRMGAFCRGR